MSSIRILAVPVRTEGESSLVVSRPAKIGPDGRDFARVRVLLPQRTHANNEVRSSGATFDGVFDLDREALNRIWRDEVAPILAAVSLGSIDTGNVLILGTARSGKATWLFGPNQSRVRESLAFLTIESLRKHFGEVDVSVAGIVGRKCIDMCLNQDKV